MFRNSDCVSCFLKSLNPEEEYDMKRKLGKQQCYNPYFSHKARGSSSFINSNAEVLNWSKNFDSTVHGIIRNFQENSLPESISILINFGTIGNHILYDADKEGHDCTMEEIWDPFSKVCRGIFCSTDQVLEQYVCTGHARNASREGNTFSLHFLTHDLSRAQSLLSKQGHLHQHDHGAGEF